MPTLESLAEFEYLSQYSQPAIGLVLNSSGEPIDPDGQAVGVQLRDSEGTELWTRAATRVELGRYEVTLSSVETSEVGTYELHWDWETGAIPQVYVHALQVGERAPAYDALPAGMKGVVESVLVKFADLFDSPYGGPHLQVYFQTHFGRNRVAQLMSSALGQLNVMAQPHMTYVLDPTNGMGGKEFPLFQWGELLVQLSYIEVLKHLVRSYTEQPNLVQVTVAHTDRRDYVNRWRDVLRDEQEATKGMIDHFKMAHLGLGKPRVLVAGGAYGPSWVHRSMFLNPARPNGFYIRYQG